MQAFFKDKEDLYEVILLVKENKKQDTQRVHAMRSFV